MQAVKRFQVGIGFATGRKSFQTVLRTYTHNWQEAGLVEDARFGLHLFVAYDLSYNNTRSTDYTRLHPEIDACIESSTFIGRGARNDAVEYLVREKIAGPAEARRLFGKGYAAQRNAVLYSSIKHNMDYLVFLDDDEYPLAVTLGPKSAFWAGQDILGTHLKHIAKADITYGHHCGYISPIPSMEFNDILREADFRLFIQAISNDIIGWDALKTVRANGGVTYADTGILANDDAVEVEEIDHAKFISGSNLCLNLTDPLRVFPFYNPPGARGEDTFLGTSIAERKVLRVPCYTFHDGFSTHRHMLHGVLPMDLKAITIDTQLVVDRFFRACIGWIRYKPLFLYITKREYYEESIKEIRYRLDETLPRLAAYFGKPEFLNISAELEEYHRNVERHHREFLETQRIWARLMAHFAHRRGTVA